MKSRKFLVALAAIAAVSMSSCSQEEELVNNQPVDNAIAFSTYIGASRGSVINLPALQAKGATGFGVLAYYTGQDKFGDPSEDADPQTPNFMYNQQVTYTAGAEGSAGKWEYSPLKYWPNNSGDMISFFAYAPYTNSFDGKEGITKLSANTDEGDPTLDFVVAANVEDQIDLLYAGAVGEEENTLLNLTKPGANDNVTLKFKHALSQISFARVVEIDGVEAKDDVKGKALDANTTITINSVTFKALNFGTKGTLNLNTGEWTVPSDGYGTKEYVLKAKTKSEDESENEDEDENVSDSKDNFVNYVITSENSTEVANLTADDSNIMFIPVVSADNTEKSTISIDYTVSTYDKNLAGEYSVINNTKTMELPEGVKFEAGKAYKFILKIGLTSVKLACDVADWGTGENLTWTTLFD